MSTLDASGTVPSGTTERWRDAKRHLWPIGLVVPALAFVALLGGPVSGGVLYWIGPIIILVVVPLIDLTVGLDPSNPPDDMIEALEKDRYYRWVVVSYLPLQYAGFLAAMGVIARGDLSSVDRIGLAITIGCIGGIGINTAHELGHKRESVERWLSKVALAQCFYGHFYIEHNRGHHVRVATPEDPASSRMGETFYSFWPRTVSGSFRSAWNLERKRYARRQQHPWRLGNDVLNAWLMSAALWGGVVIWLGVGIVPFLLIQAVLGFSLLEIINFMEHYGMLRQKVGVGERQRYERVDPSHSWNSNNIATNVLLYHLQRHSDHHANPTRRYQSLRDYAESPVLPTGYAGMLVLALVPPLFRRAMDKRVVAHFGGDLRLANLQPGKRERLLARWPVPTGPGGLDTGLDTLAGARYSTSEIAGARYSTSEIEPAGRVARAARRGRIETTAAEVLAARCPGCGYVYEVAAGNELEGFAAGTAWADIPDDWCCPDCGVREKVDFVPLTGSVS